MYLADTNILLRFLLHNDPAYPTIRQAVRILKTQTLFRGKNLL